MSAKPLRRRSRTDAELMHELSRGDLSALGRLYDRHAEDVRRFAMRATGKLENAEDITHDAFVALVDAAKRYDERYSVRAFVIGIAGKLVWQRRRRSAVARRVLGEIHAWLQRDDGHTPEAAAACHEALASCEQALQRLSQGKRLVLIMAELEGMSGPEIAEVLDIPVGTVWTRLHHARAELRRALARGSA